MFEDDNQNTLFFGQAKNKNPPILNHRIDLFLVYFLFFFLVKIKIYRFYRIKLKWINFSLKIETDLFSIKISIIQSYNFYFQDINGNKPVYREYRMFRASTNFWELSCR